MSVKLLFLVFAASMGLFLYNRTNASGQTKPGSNPGVTPSAAKDQAGGEGAAALLPDVSQPYSQSSQGAVTFHSDLGSGTGPVSSYSSEPVASPYTTTTPPSTLTPILPSPAAGESRSGWSPVAVGQTPAGGYRV